MISPCPWLSPGVGTQLADPRGNTGRGGGDIAKSSHLGDSLSCFPYFPSLLLECSMCCDPVVLPYLSRGSQQKNHQCIHKSLFRPKMHCARPPSLSSVLFLCKLHGDPTGWKLAPSLSPSPSCLLSLAEFQQCLNQKSAKDLHVINVR